MSVASEVAPEVYIPARARSVNRELKLVRTETASRGSGPTSRIAPTDRNAAVIDLAGRRATRLTAGPAEGLNSLSLDARDVAQAPLRLTRRGVIALTLLTFAVATALLFVAHLSAGAQSARGGVGSTGAAATGGFAASRVVTVQPGDTLWSIAGQVAPRQDPRPIVDRLQRLNSLRGASLTAGQTLKVS